MSDYFMNKFELNNQQARKINLWLHKGYKLVTNEEMKKRGVVKKKKATSNLLTVQSDKPQTTKSIHKKNKDAPYEPPRSILIDNTTLKPKESQFNINDILNSPIRNVNSQSNNKYMKILDKLSSHPKSYIITKLGYPSLDLKSTFKAILQKAQTEYFSMSQLVSDMDKIFLKCYEIHPKSSEVYVNTQQLQSYFKKLIDNEKQPQSLIIPPPFVPPIYQNPQLIRNSSHSSYVSISNPKKKPIIQRPLMGLSSGNISIYQKRMLGQNIKKLPSEHLARVCLIVSETRQNRDEYEFDIDNLPTKKVRQLQQFVNNCMIDDRNFFETSKPIKNQQQSDQQSLFVINSDGE